MLSRQSAPWAYAAGEPFRTIASLELLASLLCMVAFEPKEPVSAQANLLLAGATDNRGNAYV
eukprot:2001991-Lingulodinium_polyedra.AAC.1